MSMTDPVADMLTRVRNANRALLERVDIPASRLKIEVAKLLKAEGFIRAYKLIDDRKQGILRVYLKYDDQNQPLIQRIERVSKPSRRVYAGQEELPKVQGGLGVAVVSTSKGVMTDRQARKLGVGGEVLCQIW